MTKTLLTSTLLASTLLIAPLLTPATAAASPTTLSPDQATALCENRLPKLERRTSALLTRINSDEHTRGSVAWLRARAAKEREAGRETSAQLLDERADRRTTHATTLTDVRQRLTDFRTTHCDAPR